MAVCFLLLLLLLVIEITSILRDWGDLFTFRLTLKWSMMMVNIYFTKCFFFLLVLWLDDWMVCFFLLSFNVCHQNWYSIDRNKITIKQKQKEENNHKKQPSKWLMSNKFLVEKSPKHFTWPEQFICYSFFFSVVFRYFSRMQPL